MWNWGSERLDGLFKVHTDTKWWSLDLNGAGETPRLVSVNTVLYDLCLWYSCLQYAEWTERSICTLGKSCFQNIPQGTYCLVMTSLSGGIITNIYWAFAACRALPAKALNVLAHSYSEQLSNSLAHSYLRVLALAALAAYRTVRPFAAHPLGHLIREDFLVYLWPPIVPRILWFST